MSRSVAREAIRVRVDGAGRVTTPGGDHDPAAAQVERLRPAGDPLAPRRRRPRGAAALLSELRRGIEPVAASWPPSGDPHHCRILAAAVSDMVVRGRRRPAVLPARRHDLPPHAARGERQRDAAGARQRRGGPQRPHLRDDAAGRSRRRSRCTTRWRERSASATAPPRRRCAGSSRKPPRRWARRTRTDVRPACDAGGRGRRGTTAPPARRPSGTAPARAAGSRPGRSRPGRRRPAPGRSGGRRKAASRRRPGRQTARTSPPRRPGRPAAAGRTARRAAAAWSSAAAATDSRSGRSESPGPSRCSRTAGHRAPALDGDPDGQAVDVRQAPGSPIARERRTTTSSSPGSSITAPRCGSSPCRSARAPATLGVQRLRGRPDGGQGPGGDGQQRTAGPNSPDARGRAGSWGSPYPVGPRFRPETFTSRRRPRRSGRSAGPQSTGRDRLAARGAHAVRPRRDPREGLVDLGEVPLDLSDQRVDLRALERDRRALDVVLVVGIRLPGGLHDAGEVAPQAVEPLGDQIAFGVQARRGVLERAQREPSTSWMSDVPARLPLTAGTVTTLAGRLLRLGDLDAVAAVRGDRGAAHHDLVLALDPPQRGANARLGRGDAAADDEASLSGTRSGVAVTAVPTSTVNGSETLPSNDHVPAKLQRYTVRASGCTVTDGSPAPRTAATRFDRHELARAELLLLQDEQAVRKRRAHWSRTTPLIVTLACGDRGGGAADAGRGGEAFEVVRRDRAGGAGAQRVDLERLAVAPEPGRVEPGAVPAVGREQAGGGPPPGRPAAGCRGRTGSTCRSGRSRRSASRRRRRGQAGAADPDPLRRPVVRRLVAGVGDAGAAAGGVHRQARGRGGGHRADGALRSDRVTAREVVLEVAGAGGPGRG